MKDLIHHIENDNLIVLFPNEYNHVIRSLYIILRRAFLDKADTLNLTSEAFTWEKDNQQLGDFQLDDLLMYEAFRKSLYKVLERDELVQNKVKITSVSEDEIKCELEL
ncbi:MAG: hypothetical protein K8L99_18340 [Anaerolineae bacterium]|nr:hypothetical protein [Anaerolineae bacterium]